MMFSMTACGKDDDKDDNKHDALTRTEEEVVDDVATEAATEAVTPEAPETSTATGNIELAGVISYSIDGTDYTEYSTSASTNVYGEQGNLQTCAISAVDYTGLTTADVEAQFKAQIETVYGTNYDTYETTFNGLNYTTYYFGTNNIMSSDINVTCYVYAKDNVCIYVEEAWATTLGNASGDTEKLMDTITIK
ncbi:MAG: hypothetical protein Q4D54_09590 [Eubacteriales bacterium]|nr:hypothetical protein [Eubacteriales bacterium]